MYDCGQDYEPNLGTVHDEVTIGYPPDALSTGVCYHTNWRPINYTELAYPPPDYEVVTQAACSMSYGDTRTIDSSHILAGSPIFSIPGGISQVDPLWSTCTPAAPGGYDPPRALTRSQNLVPSPTPPVTQAKPEPESSAALQLPVETGGPTTATGGKSGQIPQDPSEPNGNESSDPSDSASQGAAIAGDPGSSAGNQEGSPDPQQSPSAKGNELDPPNPGTSTVPSVGGGGDAGNSPQGNTGDTPPAAPEGNPSGSNPQNAGASSTPSEEDGGTSGSTPQDNGGNVGSSAPDGPIANGADSQASSTPNTPDSVGKGVPGSVSPEVDNNGGSNIGASLQEASGGGVKVGTVTIAPGAQTTHSGHVFSVGSSFVLVDGTSFDLHSLQAGAPPGIATTTSPSQQDFVGGGIVVGTTTLTPGAQSTSSGHTISVGSSVFAVDGVSYSKASAGSGGFIIGTITLPPGAQTTASGHIVSVASDSVVIDGSAYAWAAAGASQQDLSGAGLVVGATTLPPGVQSTFSGHAISVGSSVFAVDGTSYSKASGGGFLIGTTTLPPGAQITASGHVISVASNSVVIDGSSYAWAAAGASPPISTTPAGGNLGGLILSAFGTGTTANSTASPAAFAGGAGRLRSPVEPGLLVSTMVLYIMCLYVL